MAARRSAKKEAEKRRQAATFLPQVARRGAHLGLQWRLQKQIGSDVATERGLALGTHLAPDPSAEAHGL